MKLLKNLNLKNIDNLISLAVFGSYETKYWIKNKSDIDILVLMEKREEKPKRNIKKGLTKPKTRNQRSVKKRKRDLKNEQKKGGARKDYPKKE